MSVSPTFATKKTLIFRPARLPKPKTKQICHIIRDFFPVNRGGGEGSGKKRKKWLKTGDGGNNSGEGVNKKMQKSSLAAAADKK